MRVPFGDVFVSVWLASSLKKPLSVVAKEYDVNKDKGWGVMAKNLGIKPGSDAFHSLKKDSSVELNLAQKRNKEQKTEKSEKTENQGPKVNQRSETRDVPTFVPEHKERWGDEPTRCSRNLFRLHLTVVLLHYRAY